MGALACLQIGSGGAPGGPLVGALPLLRFNSTVADLQRGRRSSPGIELATRRWLEHYLSLQDHGPVSSLYLALRAARRALRENPDDVRSYLVLAEIVTRLAKHTRERAFSENHFLLSELIRQSQAVGALHAALELKPEPEVEQVANLMLAELFSSPKFADNRIPPSRSRPRLFAGFTGTEYYEPGVGAYREYVRLSKALGRLIGVPPQQFAAELTNHEKVLKVLEDGLQARRNSYENAAARKPLLEQVAIAGGHGLAETALNLLLEALKNDPATLADKRNPRERTGATVIVRLFLGLGRLEEARQVLVPPSSPDKAIDKRGFGSIQGIPAYEWLVAQQGAAAGDYEAADKALAESVELLGSNQGVNQVLAQLDVVPQGFGEGKDANLRVLAGALTGDVLLRDAPQAAGMPWQILPHVPYRLNKPYGPKVPGWPFEMGQGSQYIAAVLHSTADLWTIRAWLALEQGRTAQAREYARKALDLSDVGAGREGVRRIMLFRSRALAVLCLERLDQPNRGRK